MVLMTELLYQIYINNAKKIFEKRGAKNVNNPPPKRSGLGK